MGFHEVITGSPVSNMYASQNEERASKLDQLVQHLHRGFKNPQGGWTTKMQRTIAGAHRRDQGMWEMKGEI